jgi:hypothetical protein
MIDAYTIGITLALEDGVSDGITAIRQDLTQLDAAVAESTSRILMLRRLAADAGLSAPAGHTIQSDTIVRPSGSDRQVAPASPFWTAVQAAKTATQSPPVAAPRSPAVAPISEVAAATPRTVPSRSTDPLASVPSALPQLTYASIAPTGVPAPNKDPIPVIQAAPHEPAGRALPLPSKDGVQTLDLVAIARSLTPPASPSKASPPSPPSPRLELPVPSQPIAEVPSPWVSAPTLASASPLAVSATKAAITVPPAPPSSPPAQSIGIATPTRPSTSPSQAIIAPIPPTATPSLSPIGPSIVAPRQPLTETEKASIGAKTGSSSQIDSASFPVRAPLPPAPRKPQPLHQFRPLPSTTLSFVPPLPQPKLDSRSAPPEIDAQSQPDWSSRSASGIPSRPLAHAAPLHVQAALVPEKLIKSVEQRQEATGAGAEDPVHPAYAELHMDGAVLGRWITRYLERQVTRPQVGSTGFDQRMTPSWPGAPIGN